MKDKKVIKYHKFLLDKSHLNLNFGFKPLFMPDFLFDFQKELVDWAIIKGRGAIFADCGMGKTPIQLVWAKNIVKKTNKNVLVITPLSVGHQTVKEGKKFRIKVTRSDSGKPFPGITITNYEKLHLFNPNDFIGAVCDESSILKNFDGARRKIITEFLKKMPYRLLCTATAAPNDYIELGTSSEALGVLGYMDMLNRFFKNLNNTIDTKGGYRGVRQKWRFKKHAEDQFWKWVCSWARALRKPSDMGFDDTNFILPELIEKETTIPYSRPIKRGFFIEPAKGLKEQREERRATIQERCEAVAEKIDSNIAVVWCHLNAEADLLERIIPNSKQVSGSMSDEEKEKTFIDFSDRNLQVLITKPRIGAFGLNWQHCSHITFFPSHSYEQYYQAVRRCWRFGQKNKVIVDIITTEGELSVLENLKKKTIAADKMFTKLVGFMNDSIKITNKDKHTKKERIPEWL